MASARRANRSKVAQLPAALKTEVDRLLFEGRFTLEQIVAHLRGLGVDVSRSAVHRYSQNYDEMMRDMRLARELSQAIGKELADVDGDGGRLVIESLQPLLLRVRMQIASGEDIDAKELQTLTRAAKDLQHALKLNVESEVKVRERIAKEVAEKLTTGPATKKLGLTSETVESIKATILGVKHEP